VVIKLDPAVSEQNQTNSKSCSFLQSNAKVKIQNLYRIR
jgi:hypothetical protein